MASYNLFLATATQGATPLGLKAGTLTLLEALQKETLEPAEPSTTTGVSSVTEGKGTFTLAVPLALHEELLGGAKITAFTVHANIEQGGGTGEKRQKFGVVSPEVISEPTIAKSTRVWETVSLSTAQAEALTAATLATLELVLAATGGKAWLAYEIYVSLTTAGAIKLSGQVSVAMAASGKSTSAVTVHGAASLSTAAHATSASHAAVHGSASLAIAASAHTASAVAAHGAASLTIGTHATGTSHVAVAGAAHLTVAASAATASRVTVAAHPRLTVGVVGAITEHAGETVALVGHASLGFGVHGAVTVRTTIAGAAHVLVASAVVTATRVTLSRGVHAGFAASAGVAVRMPLEGAVAVRFASASASVSRTSVSGNVAFVVRVAGHVRAGESKGYEGPLSSETTVAVATPATTSIEPLLGATTTITPI